MRIGVLGTGSVGQTVGAKLVAIGHEVCMGSREAGNEAARAWADSAGERASVGAFADAAAFGELLVNATAGVHSLAALQPADAEDLEGKVLLDLANPLDFSHGMPPTLSVANTDSLGEQLQRAFPGLRVVKALNTMSCEVMVDPAGVPGRHNAFMAGDDEGAKQTVRSLLVEMGWPDDDVLDLGGIEAARGTEMYLPLWLRLWQATGSRYINISVQRS